METKLMHALEEKRYCIVNNNTELQMYQYSHENEVLIFIRYALEVPYIIHSCLYYHQSHILSNFSYHRYFRFYATMATF